jgi:hypothetical protein
LAALQEAGASPRAASSTGECLAPPRGGKREDPEDPTLQIDTSLSGSARTTKLILELGAGDDPGRNGSATRTSHRWSRLAAGAVLVGLALGANVLSTHQRALPGASGEAAPVTPIAEPSAQAAMDPADEGGAKAPRGPVATPRPSATAPVPPGAAGGESQAAPKKQQRSSEERPGWVIRRE